MPLLFAYDLNRFSNGVAHIIIFVPVYPVVFVSQK